MKINRPTILIIIGIFGDLSVRKLLPALSKMAAAGALPADFRILGITRRSDSKIEDLFAKTDKKDYLRQHLELLSMDLTSLDDYHNLAEYLSKMTLGFTSKAQHLFYLAVPPQVSRPIIELLGISGLADNQNNKLLLEKPFGTDLASAQELVEYIDKYFKPEQVYRIDHYLAKEMAQNIILFRENNFLFKQTWNKDFITHIEIIASEEIGVEGRALFYEQTGALRDLVQSHLLQLAALTLVNAPSEETIKDVPTYRLKALQQLHLPSDDIDKFVRRGQYATYQKEVNNLGSTVETFVSLTLESDDPKWQGVPITLTTGKALDKKFTGIKIYYRQNEDRAANQLTFFLQPDEGVEFSLFSKRPGYDYTVSRHPLKFSFQEHYANLPEAYEQVLFSAMNSDYNLFATSAEVLESWRIIDKIQKAWEMSDDDLIIYESGHKISDVLKIK
jgi:glucose-6-phosphate 1-dehydrogenase